MADEFRLIVIGAGPAGEKAAAQAAYFGHRTAIVERAARPGGATVLTGGVPTKTLRETALYVSGFQRRTVYGVGMELDLQTEMELLRSRAAQVVDTMTDVVAQNIDRRGIELIHGSAHLAPGGRVIVDGDDGETRTLQGETILIASGSRPFQPSGIPFTIRTCLTRRPCWSLSGRLRASWWSEAARSVSSTPRSLPRSACT